jgi:AcrR family transcriptional regulator
MSERPAAGSRGDRRAQVIETAVVLLREGGSDALTSVAVAQRMGIAQSAVYRHVSTIDELRRLATDEIVTDLRRALHGILVSPEMQDLGDEHAVFLHVIDAMGEHRQAYATVDRWRFEDGCFGAGIREVCAEFDDMIAQLLEGHYRTAYDAAGEWPDAVRTAQHDHARHFQDEGYAVARLVHQGGDRVELARILRYRSLWAWISYVIDMHDRLGRGLPRFDIDAMFP